MKKIRKACALALGAIAVASLASCNAQKDETVTSIKITDGSISTSYVKGAQANYNDLSIDLYNKGNEKIKTLKWADNKETITHDDIDTSALGSDKVFTVTYTEGEKSFSDSLTYSVSEATYVFTSWAANDNYVYTTSYKANSKISSDEDDPETGLMKTGKFYVGNMNAVNLLPKLNGYCAELDDTMTLKEIPNGATVTLSKDGNAVKTSEYIENESSFVKDGLLKFKSTVTGSFKVTLSLAGQKDLVYEMEVVDAYNVRQATDLFAFYTSSDAYEFGKAFASQVQTYKEETLHLPDAENLVIQNDIKIGKSAMPSCYIWQADEGCDPSVVGSLKDWLPMIDHEFKAVGEKSTIYGNMHQISLNDDATDPDHLPYILTDNQGGVAQEEGKAISSHAALFYASFTKDAGLDPSSCEIVFKDLQAVGNRGVSEESGITEGGPMFVKTETGASFDNVSVSKFYMAAMTCGADSLGTTTYKVGDKYVIPSISFDSCRVRDSANAGVYVYGTGSIDIKNSDMAKSGGPLLFLNPASDELLPDYATVAAGTYTGHKLYTTVNIDDASFLSNYTAGSGGWFDSYENASVLASALKAENALFASSGMSFTRKKNDVEKFNLVALNLPINGSEGLGLRKAGEGCTNVTIKKGGKTVYSTLEGYSDVLTGLIGVNAATADTTTAAYTAYGDALSKTFFGNNLAYANIENEMVFAAMDSEGNHEFAMINLDASGNQFLCSSEFAVKSAMAAAGVVTPSSATPGNTFKSEGYLACTINGKKAAGEAYTSNELTGKDFFTYSGPMNYGIVLGDYHKI